MLSYSIIKTIHIKMKHVLAIDNTHCTVLTHICILLSQKKCTMQLQMSTRPDLRNLQLWASKKKKKKQNKNKLGFIQLSMS